MNRYVEFDKQQVEVQDCMKITNQFEKNPWNIPQISKGNPKDHSM